MRGGCRLLGAPVQISAPLLDVLLKYCILVVSSFALSHVFINQERPLQFVAYASYHVLMEVKG